MRKTFLLRLTQNGKATHIAARTVTKANAAASAPFAANFPKKKIPTPNESAQKSIGLKLTGFLKNRKTSPLPLSSIPLFFLRIL